MRKEVDDQRARVSTTEKASSTNGPAGKTDAAGKTPPGKARTYVVHEGDTPALDLAFYAVRPLEKNPHANRSIIDDPGKLKPGQTLTIP